MGQNCQNAKELGNAVLKKKKKIGRKFKKKFSRLREIPLGATNKRRIKITIFFVLNARYAKRNK